MHEVERQYREALAQDAAWYQAPRHNSVAYIGGRLLILLVWLPIVLAMVAWWLVA